MGTSATVRLIRCPLNTGFTVFEEFIYFTRCRIEIFTFEFHNTYQCRQLSLAIAAFAFSHNALSCTMVGHQLFTAGILACLGKEVSASKLIALIQERVMVWLLSSPRTSFTAHTAD